MNLRSLINYAKAKTGKNKDLILIYLEYFYNENFQNSYEFFLWLLKDITNILSV